MFLQGLSIVRRRIYPTAATSETNRRQRALSSAAVISTCLARGRGAAKVVMSSKEQLNQRALQSPSHNDNGVGVWVANIIITLGKQTWSSGN